MKLQEYFQTLNKETVLLLLVELYPSQEKNLEGYSEAWDEILTLSPVKTDDTVIEVYNCVTEWGDPTLADEDYISVHGLKDNQSWALEFCPWEEWLNWEVTAIEDPRCNTKEQILAHILFEMTFCGYSAKEISEERDYLQKLSDEVDKSIEDGTISDKCTSFEEFMEEMKNEK